MPRPFAPRHRPSGNPRSAGMGIGEESGAVPAARLRFAYAKVAGLSPAEFGALWTVYAGFFETERRTFEEAARRSDEVIRFYDADDGRLCGMALVSAYAASHAGRAFRVLSTGAVCIEPRYRGLTAIQRAGLFRLLRERLRPGIADLLPADHDPHVRHFFRLNPGHAAGERLPCLCPLNLGNVAAIAQIALRRAWRRTPS